MITYRYVPYEPEGENKWNMDRLMGIVSELIMRYSTGLDQALKLLIDRGLPVNLFLKEGGMGNLMQQFIEQLAHRKASIASEYTLQAAFHEIDQDVLKKQKQILKTAPELKEELGQIIADSSLDRLMKLKWYMEEENLPLEKLARDIEDRNTLIEGQQRYNFHGHKKLNRQQALKLLKNLDEMETLQQALREGMENGDLLNFNLEDLARYLGPEQYQEYLEKREEILKKLKQLLEQKGQVIHSDSDDELKLSPQAIRRIGKMALQEIFSSLKSDSTGSHFSSEEGHSENLSASTRPLVFGDSLAAMDVSASFLNAIIRKGEMRPDYRDIEIFRSRGSARSSTVILIDMSGSMQRANRFYHAKKVALALDALISEEFKDDRLIIAGFGSLARQYNQHEIPALEPFDITIFDPHIRLRFDMRREKHSFLPRYFTNLQRGLELGRQLLGSGETKNKQIILITDGVPTAHFEGHTLHINYPPSPDDFGAALREVRACSQSGIVINTFLLTSDWEVSYFGEEAFIKQFARESMGRIFYPHATELNKMILMDFIGQKKKLLSY